jgi:hypothetical protein
VKGLGVGSWPDAKIAVTVKMTPRTMGRNATSIIFNSTPPSTNKEEVGAAAAAV